MDLTLQAYGEASLESLKILVGQASILAIQPIYILKDSLQINRMHN